MPTAFIRALVLVSLAAATTEAQAWGEWETIHGSGSGAEGRIEIAFARSDCSAKPYENVPFRWNSTYTEPVRVTIAITFTRCKSDGGTQTFSATLTGGVQDLDGQYIGGLASVSEVRVTRVTFPNRADGASAASARASAASSGAAPNSPAAASAPQTPASAPASGSASTRRPDTAPEASAESRAQQAEAARRADAQRVTQANADVTRRTEQRIDGINRASADFNSAVERAFGNTPEERARQEAADAREEAERERRRRAAEEADRRLADSLRRAESTRQANNARLAAANNARLQQRMALADAGRANAEQLVQLAEMFHVGFEGIPTSLPAYHHYLRLAVAKGSNNAEWLLGASLLNDTGDTTEALEILTRRHARGDGLSAHYLGRVAERRGRYAEAITLYREAWQKGREEQLGLDLGRALVEHGGSEADRREGVAIVSEAANMGRGYSYALLYLANLHASGRAGVDRDFRIADSLLIRANSESHYLRGEMRLIGQGARFPRHVFAGMSYLSTAVDDSGKVVSDRYAGILARFYYEGWADTLNPTGGSTVVPGADPRYTGRRVTRYYGLPETDVSTNQSRALLWARTGASIGDTLASYILARLELEGARSVDGSARRARTVETIPRNVPSALARLEDLAQRRYEPARVLLAELHLENRSVRREPSRVPTLLADVVSPRGLFLVGRMYEEGIGVPADVNKAIEAYTRAAEGREVDAMDRLAALFRRGARADATLAKQWRDRAEAFRVTIADAPLHLAR